MRQQAPYHHLCRPASRSVSKGEPSADLNPETRFRVAPVVAQTQFERWREESAAHEQVFHGAFQGQAQAADIRFGRGQQTRCARHRVGGRAHQQGV